MLNRQQLAPLFGDRAFCQPCEGCLFCAAWCGALFLTDAEAFAACWVDGRGFSCSPGAPPLGVVHILRAARRRRPTGSFPGAIWYSAILKVCYSSTDSSVHARLPAAAHLARRRLVPLVLCEPRYCGVGPLLLCGCLLHSSVAGGGGASHVLLHGLQLQCAPTNTSILLTLMLRSAVSSAALHGAALRCAYWSMACSCNMATSTQSKTVGTVIACRPLQHRATVGRATAHCFMAYNCSNPIGQPISLYQLLMFVRFEVEGGYRCLNWRRDVQQYNNMRTVAVGAATEALST